MTAHKSKTKTSAKKLASRARGKGLKASVYKMKKGYGVSVTKK